MVTMTQGFMVTNTCAAAQDQSSYCNHYKFDPRPLCGLDLEVIGTAPEWRRSGMYHISVPQISVYKTDIKSGIAYTIFVSDFANWKIM